MQFFEPDPKIEILFQKERAAEETNVNFEIGFNAPAAKQCCGKSHTEPICFLPVWSLEKKSLFICYLAAPQQTLGYYQEDSHCYPMLITAF